VSNIDQKMRPVGRDGRAGHVVVVANRNKYKIARAAASLDVEASPDRRPVGHVFCAGNVLVAARQQSLARPRGASSSC
jgi:hypothetical protein